ncbi:VAN3-binding protein isoform X2 [Vigna unguiculata]|uniref:VAN3-binding protein isoform X2 n=1 Tax=Vigna unguiculata TaxID=3917 RepID=UPI0010162D3B|nr:VAN3-binding protein isoform X2 [Vigna unguiculata]
MASDFNLSPSDAHPETMDFLSLAWCNFAVQAIQPEPQHGSVVLLDNNSMKPLEPGSPNANPSSARMDGTDFGPLPGWKSNNVKSWIWMQQAMHPELNYNSCFRKKWVPWKQIIPLKSVSIKKWFKEIKMKKKEDQRLQRAEVHAAISIAGVAAALAAIAAENSKKESNQDRDAAVASAAALVAAQCAKVAEAMGAKKEQLSSVIGSAMSGTSASDILTLTAAAATSLKGAATLKVRSGCKNRLNGGVPVMPLEDSNDLDFDFEKGRSILAQGAELYVETPEGKYMPRSVSIILSSEAKVVLMMRKHNLFKSKKEGIVMTLHAQLYKGSEAEDADTCYLIVLTTRGGVFKLDMADDYRRYKTWSTTINHMLKISASFAKYELQFY